METYFGDIEEAHSRLARERAVADLKTLTRDAEALLKATAHDMSDKAKEARSRIATSLTRAKTTVGELQAQAVAGLKVAAKRTDAVVRERPYGFIGLAFGVGLLIGFLSMRKDPDEPRAT